MDIDIRGMSFTRKKEDFKCLHCGKIVQGDGYTNHCPECLWGCHVDITPGDRQEKCHGVMEPISAKPERDGFIVAHQCAICGAIRINRSTPFDNSDILILLSTYPFPEVNS